MPQYINIKNLQKAENDVHRIPSWPIARFFARSYPEVVSITKSEANHDVKNRQMESLKSLKRMMSKTVNNEEKNRQAG